MIRKYLLPLLAVIGVIFSIYSVIVSNKPAPVAAPVVQPSKAPFGSYIAGAGIIEASTENIAIGTPLSGIVTDVPVKVGSKVNIGDPLFSLDERDLRAELTVKRAALQTAKEKLTRLESLPRQEDIPPAEARVKAAEATLADLKHQLDLSESITDKRAISIDELNRRRYAVQAAEARLNEMKAQLMLLRAGAWKSDIEVAKAEVFSAEAQVKAAETNIERLTVRAPVDGEILQLNVRLGEFAQAGSLQKPLVILGNLDRLHVRVDIDENDAWRFKRDARAIAFVRGNREMKAQLRYERTEPYVIPKRSLTGDSIERVDTRVMQAVYSFDRGELPVYVGQQMDVFIEAPPVSDVSAAKINEQGKTERGKP
ncbi:MAG: biotin/lipoyl-binding protein [Nitrospinae bacterium]|nr:biotin/lipoyl-binding protein [Nitrospinota bacterium]